MSQCVVVNPSRITAETVRRHYGTFILFSPPPRQEGMSAKISSSHKIFNDSRKLWYLETRLPPVTSVDSAILYQNAHFVVISSRKILKFSNLSKYLPITLTDSKNELKNGSKIKS